MKKSTGNSVYDSSLGSLISLMYSHFIPLLLLWTMANFRINMHLTKPSEEQSTRRITSNKQIIIRPLYLKYSRHATVPEKHIRKRIGDVERRLWSVFFLPPILYAHGVTYFRRHQGRKGTTSAPSITQHGLRFLTVPLILTASPSEPVTSASSSSPLARRSASQTQARRE